MQWATPTGIRIGADWHMLCQESSMLWSRMWYPVSWTFMSLLIHHPTFEPNHSQFLQSMLLEIRSGIEMAVWLAEREMHPGIGSVRAPHQLVHAMSWTLELEMGIGHKFDFRWFCLSLEQVCKWGLLNESALTLCNSLRITNWWANMPSIETHRKYNYGLVIVQCW